MKYKIPVLKISTNKIYSGMHWAKRNKIKNDYLLLVMSANIKEKYVYLNKLVFNFYLTGRVLDTTNLSFMAKMIEDSFIKLGVLKNDSPAYYNRVELVCNPSKTSEDYCIVEFIKKTSSSK